MRTICIGDIHGCFDEFAELVNKLGYERSEDRLVLLGDLIDRGPDPAGVIRFARTIGAECVKGNHEEKALRWRKHEKRKVANPLYVNPMKPVNPERLAQWAAIRDEDWDWLESLPAYLHIDDDWTAIHAGAVPTVPIEEQDPNHLMRMRYINIEKMKMMSPNDAGEMQDGCGHWTDFWKGPRKIVYGHYTYDTDPKVTSNTIGIDTGCVHGLTLTAYTIEKTMAHTVTQVKAKKVYSERKAWNDEP